MVRVWLVQAEAFRQVEMEQSLRVRQYARETAKRVAVVTEAWVDVPYRLRGGPSREGQSPPHVL
jgi:hypothetical protein